MKDIKKLKSQEAIHYVKSELGFTSYYSIAKELSKDDKLTVQPIQISNYDKGKRVMSEKVADHFYEVFSIIITDAFHSKGRPPAW